MLAPLNLCRDVYRGYAGDGENHVVRLAMAATISIAMALNSSSLSKDSLATIAVIVSVLAGFSFTALFSSHSHSTADLPDAKSENDRHDLRTLKILFENFRDRARYFLVIAIFCLLATFFVSVLVDISQIKAFLDSLDMRTIFEKLYLIWNVLCFLIRLVSLFLFLEILYSFYRLAETVFAILDTRRGYLEKNR